MKTNTESDLMNKLLEKENNVSKVVDRFLRMRLKRRIKKLTGICLR